MTLQDVLGLPLEAASARLANEGYTVSQREVRCRKDVTDTDLRVIHAETSGIGSVILYYSAFRTTAETN